MSIVNINQGNHISIQKNRVELKNVNYTYSFAHRHINTLSFYNLLDEDLTNFDTNIFKNATIDRIIGKSGKFLLDFASIYNVSEVYYPHFIKNLDQFIEINKTEINANILVRCDEIQGLLPEHFTNPNIVYRLNDNKNNDLILKNASKISHRDTLSYEPLRAYEFVELSTFDSKSISFAERLQADELVIFIHANVGVSQAINILKESQTLPNIIFRGNTIHDIIINIDELLMNPYIKHLKFVNFKNITYTDEILENNTTILTIQTSNNTSLINEICERNATYTRFYSTKSARK